MMAVKSLATWHCGKYFSEIVCHVQTHTLQAPQVPKALKHNPYGLHILWLWFSSSKCHDYQQGHVSDSWPATCSLWGVICYFPWFVSVAHALTANTTVHSHFCFTGPSFVHFGSFSICRHRVLRCQFPWLPCRMSEMLQWWASVIMTVWWVWSGIIVTSCG